MPRLFESAPSEDAKNILRLLKNSHNVIIVGPPATGKSTLLAEVRYWFAQATTPAFQPKGNVAFPSNKIGQANVEWHPSPEKTERKIYQITFHQGTKYRDFVAGLIPDPTAHFKISYGKFHLAAEHAASVNGAVLLEIDELNRANAVAVFGDTITAIESDKRLNVDGSVGELTAVYSSLDSSGQAVDHHLSSHLYIIGAMNNADTSVQPLDVAFLRRFELYALKPSEAILREFFGITNNGSSLPQSPGSVEDVFEALTQTWVKINDDISLLRGNDYQIGQGLFMRIYKDNLPDKLPEALEYVLTCWNRLFAHISEVFFGDTQALANILHVDAPGNPYTLQSRFYAGASISRIQSPVKLTPINVYDILFAIVTDASD